jgi:hypothetical protein
VAMMRFTPLLDALWAVASRRGRRQMVGPLMANRRRNQAPSERSAFTLKAEVAWLDPRERTSDDRLSPESGRFRRGRLRSLFDPKGTFAAESPVTTECANVLRRVGAVQKFRFKMSRQGDLSD